MLERVGVATGGSNVQFAVHPETGRMVIIEMNPRVSRSRFSMEHTMMPLPAASRMTSIS